MEVTFGSDIASLLSAEGRSVHSGMMERSRWTVKPERSLDTTSPGRKRESAFRKRIVPALTHVNRTR